MSPSMKWLFWALGLLAVVCVLDVLAFVVGASTANAMTVRDAGSVVIGLLAVYLLVGLVATGVLWWQGRAVGAGVRTVGTIAFLLLQGLVFAFMSLTTLL